MCCVFELPIKRVGREDDRPPFCCPCHMATEERWRLAIHTLEHVQVILVVCDYRAFNALRQVKALLISRVFPAIVSNLVIVLSCSRESLFRLGGMASVTRTKKVPGANRVAVNRCYRLSSFLRQSSEPSGQTSPKHRPALVNHLCMKVLGGTVSSS